MGVIWGGQGKLGGASPRECRPFRRVTGYGSRKCPSGPRLASIILEMTGRLRGQTDKVKVWAARKLGAPGKMAETIPRICGVSVS